MSSSSSSPDFSRPCPMTGCYDVFLSFRGADTRYAFTYYLYHSLMENKVHTFMDIKLVGEVIESLLEIIKRSKMAVVVYSESFASSEWCLRELEKILKRKNKKKILVIPIFYKVKVDELKHLTGNTGKYLDEHVPLHGKTTVKKWKDAVTALGHVSGLSYDGDSYERIFIAEVIKTVKEMLEEWEDPVGSSIKPHSGPEVELHKKTSVVSPFVGGSVGLGSWEAAKRAEDRKTSKYGPGCSANGLSFEPFVMESLGGFGDRADRLISILAARWAEARDLEPPAALSMVRQKLSFVSQKALADGFLMRNDYRLSS